MARIFNNNLTLDTNSATEYIKEKIGGLVPYLNSNKGYLGDDSIYLAISLEPKSEWPHGIFENSQNFRMVIYHSGEMEVFTQSLYKKSQRNCYEGRLKTKFRKCTAKSIEDVVRRIKIFVDKVNAEINE